MSTELEIRKYMRRPFDVEAVQVTAENFEAVAEWCGGKIVTVHETIMEEGEDYGKPADRRHIAVEVARPLTRRQTEAYLGDWVLYASKGFKVYGNRPFAKNFTLRGEGSSSSESAEELFVTDEPATTDDILETEPAVVTVDDQKPEVNLP